MPYCRILISVKFFFGSIRWKNNTQYVYYTATPFGAVQRKHCRSNKTQTCTCSTIAARAGQWTSKFVRAYYQAGRAGRAAGLATTDPALSEITSRSTSTITQTPPNSITVNTVSSLRAEYLYNSGSRTNKDVRTCCQTSSRSDKLHPHTASTSYALKLKQWSI